MNKTISTSLIIAIAAACTLTACGRNPGAKARAYPGTEKIEAAMAAAQPKCVSFDPKEIHGQSIVDGKEKFGTSRKGVFKLDSYVISQATDRPDRVVPNSIFQVTEFEDLASAAPRLAIEAKCVDLKNQTQSLALAPVTRINSETGMILQSQPFDLEVDTAGKMSAQSELPLAQTAQILPVGKIPESAILLGTDYTKTFKTISFHVVESADGSLTVKAEFIGMDPNTLSRILVRVEAVYGWDSGE
jgi:hypothetical protein